MTRTVFSQILSAVSFLHDKGFAHRDIKLENFLLDNEGRVKLIDFGLSKNFHKSTLSTYCGSPGYAAPELVKNKGK